VEHFREFVSPLLSGQAKAMPLGDGEKPLLPPITEAGSGSRRRTTPRSRSPIHRI